MTLVPHLTTTAHRNWRELALQAMLRAEAANGDATDALLAQIQAERPAAHVLVVTPDRDRLVAFLDAHHATALIDGTVSFEYGESYAPYLSWSRLMWNNVAIEIVVTPADYNGDVLCLADDVAALTGLVTALEHFTIRPTGRALVYATSWRPAPELDAELGAVTWDDIVLPAALRSEIRDAVEGFVRHRSAYEALGFAWRRGVLLIGPPGTGKTMIGRAIAASLPELPFLYVRDLREQNGRDAIKTIFARARAVAPCILAFEDIDGLAGEHNRTVLLNELDGLQNNDGLLILASSNHPERIDEALLKRPSRFDRVFHIGLPAWAERVQFCQHVLSRSALQTRLNGVDVAALAEQVAERTSGFTPAYLKEVLMSAALHCAQQGITVLDERFAAQALREADQLRRYLRQARDPEALATIVHDTEHTFGFLR